MNFPVLDCLEETAIYGDYLSHMEIDKNVYAYVYHIISATG